MYLNEFHRYIRNFCKSQSAEEYVQRVREARPLIRWHAESYHYEIRSQTRIQVRSAVRNSPNGLFTLLGNGTGTGTRDDEGDWEQWVLICLQICSHWSETGKGTKIYCFLLCWSSSPYLSRSHSRVL